MGRAHTSRTALRTRVCMLVCLDQPLTINFKMNAIPIFHDGLLLPDCRVGVKESKSKDDSSWMLAARTRQLSELWYESYHSGQDSLAASERIGGLLQVSLAWPLIQSRLLLLVHGSTVKLSPCPCSHSSPAGRIVVHAYLCSIWNVICYSLRLALGWRSIFLVHVVLLYQCSDLPLTRCVLTVTPLNIF